MNNVPDWLNWDEKTLKDYDMKESKYSYIYGVKEIEARYKEFQSSSIYVSRPFQVDGNVAEVSLSSKEEHPMVNTENKLINPFNTSIEYYISFQEYPTVDDWLPILPQEEDYIKSEFLQFEEHDICELRFPRDEGKEIVIYKNGIKLNRQFWSIIGDNKIKIEKGFDKYSIYTARYHPSMKPNSPWDISLKDKDRNIVNYSDDLGNEYETFEHGTNRNGAISLSKYPYIDYNLINEGNQEYVPIKVTLESKSDTNMIAAPNSDTVKIVKPKLTPFEKSLIDGAAPTIYTENMTDYKYMTDVNLVPYNLETNLSTMKPTNLVFEYKHDGRQLYFTETFNKSENSSNQKFNHGNANIKVEYKHILTNTRIKIILRNISNKDNFTTPTISEYNLIFKILK